MSVYPSFWPPTGRIFVKFDILVFFENLSRKFKFDENLTGITEFLHVDMQIWDCVSLKVRFVEKIKTLFVELLFSSKIVSFMRYCWTIWYSQTVHIWQYNTRMHFVCQITKGCRHALRMYNIVFPRQQWLCERTWVLRCYVRLAVVESLPQSHLLMQSCIINVRTANCGSQSSAS